MNRFAASAMPMPSGRAERSHHNLLPGKGAHLISPSFDMYGIVVTSCFHYYLIVLVGTYKQGHRDREGGDEGSREHVVR